MSNLGQVIRQALARNTSVTVIMAILLFALSGVLLFRMASPAPPAMTFFYDSADGKLYLERRDAIPPTVAPSGGEGWQAVVYACGSCSESSRKVAYVARYDPKVKEAMIAHQMIDPDLLTRGHLVRRTDDDTWHSINSSQGQAIVAAAGKLCGDTPPTICNP